MKGSVVNPRAVRISAIALREKEDFAAGLALARAAAAAQPDETEWAALLAEFQYRSGDRAKAAETLAKLAKSPDLEEVLGG